MSCPGHMPRAAEEPHCRNPFSSLLKGDSPRGLMSPGNLQPRIWEEKIPPGQHCNSICRPRPAAMLAGALPPPGALLSCLPLHFRGDFLYFSYSSVCAGAESFPSACRKAAVQQHGAAIPHPHARSASTNGRFKAKPRLGLGVHVSPSAVNLLVCQGSRHHQEPPAQTQLPAWQRHSTQGDTHSAT